MAEIDGIEAFRRQTRALRDNAARMLGETLRVEAEQVIAVSRDQYCPVDTGALRSTARVEGPETRGAELTVTLAYGGQSDTGAFVDYELPVHERLDVHHPIGQAKFLEIPAVAAEAGIEARLAVALEREIVRRIPGV